MRTHYLLRGDNTETPAPFQSRKRWQAEARGWESLSLSRSLSLPLPLPLPLSLSRRCCYVFICMFHNMITHTHSSWRCLLPFLLVVVYLLLFWIFMHTGAVLFFYWFRPNARLLWCVVAISDLWCYEPKLCQSSKHQQRLWLDMWVIKGAVCRT